ncbi:hypothetical protein BASA60_009745 [Batrachochytrium salamandrivorans]|nr:hypothetical protein BASA60_009745 [Batrachochytrium salamandrivorans]
MKFLLYSIISLLVLSVDATATSNQKDAPGNPSRCTRRPPGSLRSPLTRSEADCLFNQHTYSTTRSPVHRGNQPGMHQTGASRVERTPPNTHPGHMRNTFPNSAPAQPRREQPTSNGMTPRGRGNSQGSARPSQETKRKHRAVGRRPSGQQHSVRMKRPGAPLVNPGTPYPKKNPFSYPKNSINPKNPLDPVEELTGLMKKLTINPTKPNPQVVRPGTSSSPKAGSPSPQQRTLPRHGPVHHPQQQTLPRHGPVHHPPQQTLPRHGPVHHPQQQTLPRHGPVHHPQQQTLPRHGPVHHPQQQTLPRHGPVHHLQQQTLPRHGPVHHPQPSTSRQSTYSEDNSSVGFSSLLQGLDTPFKPLSSGKPPIKRPRLETSSHKIPIKQDMPKSKKKSYRKKFTKFLRGLFHSEYPRLEHAQNVAPEIGQAVGLAVGQKVSKTIHKALNFYQHIRRAAGLAFLSVASIVVDYAAVPVHMAKSVTKDVKRFARKVEELNEEVRAIPKKMSSELSRLEEMARTTGSGFVSGLKKSTNLAENIKATEGTISAIFDDVLRHADDIDLSENDVIKKVAKAKEEVMGRVKNFEFGSDFEFEFDFDLQDQEGFDDAQETDRPKRSPERPSGKGKRRSSRFQRPPP